MTPYGGGSGGGKKSAQYAGFYSLPEVGERVLVEFLGDWDSEAVVIGVIRQHPQGTTYNPKHTKRWSTPSGNEVIMNTQGGRDVFQVKTAGKMAFESQIEQGRHSVTINSGGNPSDMIHFEGTNGGTRLDIHVTTDMHMQAGNNITLEAKSINLIATKRIHTQSDEDSVTTQAQIDVTHKAVTGAVADEAEKNVSLNSVSGGVVITGKAGIGVQTPADVNVKGGTIHLNGG